MEPSLPAEASGLIHRLCALLNEAHSLNAVVDGTAVHLLLPDQTPVSVVVPAGDREMVFYSPLRRIDSVRDVVLMAAALTLNLHQESTRGGAIGLDPGSNALVFSWRTAILPEADPTEEMGRLIAALDDFCGVVLDLKLALDSKVALLTAEEREEIESQAAQHVRLTDLTGDDLFVDGLDAPINPVIRG